MRRRKFIVPGAMMVMVSLSLTACGDGAGESFLKDRSFSLVIDAEQWTEPISVGEVIGGYVPAFLLGVTDASDASIRVIGALVMEDCEDEQDLCQETIAFPEGTLDEGMSFSVGPADFPILVHGFPVSIRELTITATLEADGSGIHDGSFTGVLDAREVVDFFATDADGVCAMCAAIGTECQPCPSDSQVYCVTIKAENIQAAEVPGLTVVEVLTPSPDCDADDTCQPNDKLVEYRDGFCDGYTLYSPNESTTTFLMDMCGEEVHTWESNYTPGHAVYLLENGHLLRTGNTRNQNFSQGGVGGVVEEFNWDGELLWSFEYSDSQVCLHHDIEPLPNGNILMIAWERKTSGEAVAAGRDPERMSFPELWPDHVIEVQPTYPRGGSIVWEWHAWDHLVQDFDPQKANHGDVAAHPELLDINFFGGIQAGADWNHMNAIDYNAELDQILLSLHNTSEIIVIDHGTSTEEAAGHTGGRYGKGGDVLYRWGNPQAYRCGDSGDQVLFGQHDAHWIQAGLPGEGNILMFNNGMGRPDHELYSTVDEIVSPVGADGSYAPGSGCAYGPQELAWQYQAENPSDFFSPAISGAQRLPNGNTLICSGKNGIIFEVTAEGETVWEYHTEAGTLFRATRYAPDYPGLADLTP